MSCDSREVYGEPERLPVTEDAPIQPESIYAESKAITERILHWYGITHGLRSVEHNGGLDNWLLKTSDEKLSTNARKVKKEIAKKVKAAA